MAQDKQSYREKPFVRPCVLAGGRLLGIPLRWGVSGMPAPTLTAASGDYGHSLQLVALVAAARHWVREGDAPKQELLMWPAKTPERGKQASVGNICENHTPWFSAGKVKKLLSLHLKVEKNIGQF